MKKQINIFLVLLLILTLSSCITSQDDVNKAKQNLGIIEGNQVTNDLGSNVVNETNTIKDDINNNKIIQDSIVDIEENIQLIEEKKEVKRIEIKSLTDNQLLELDDLSGKNLLGGEVEITGKTLGKVDKIIVTFSNETSDFPIDTYTLKQFKAGAESFLYRAFSRYETLDFGKNIYIFEAYSGDIITKLELIVNVFEDDESKISEEVFDEIVMGDLPSGIKYGTPTDLGNGKIGYTDLNGLEIKRDVNPGFTCEKVTSILADDISGYFYWNTCRPIEGDEGISFFVVRLDGDKYIYEKHYYLSYEGLYGIQELETGTGITSINIGEKNSELKEKNEDFGILKITDDLFKEILK